MSFLSCCILFPLCFPPSPFFILLFSLLSFFLPPFSFPFPSSSSFCFPSLPLPSLSPPFSLLSLLSSPSPFSLSSLLFPLSFLLSQYLERLELVPVFKSEEEIAHWFLPRPDIVTCYVVEVCLHIVFVCVCVSAMERRKGGGEEIELVGRGSYSRREREDQCVRNIGDLGHAPTTKNFKIIHWDRFWGCFRPQIHFLPVCSLHVCMKLATVRAWSLCTYRGTSEFNVGTGPGMPGCSYATAIFKSTQAPPLQKNGIRDGAWVQGYMYITFHRENQTTAIRTPRWTFSNAVQQLSKLSRKIRGDVIQPISSYISANWYVFHRLDRLT